MLNRQLELSLKAERINRRHGLRGPRSTAAQWWFERMRRLVDDAVDYPPAKRDLGDPLTQLHSVLRA